jgi:RIO kinase 1
VAVARVAAVAGPAAERRRIAWEEEQERLYAESFFDDAPVGRGGGGRKSRRAAGAGAAGAHAAARAAPAAAKHTEAKAVRKFEHGQAVRSKEAVRQKGRADRATTEQVMDPRTRLMLFGLINANVFQKLHGCVSTGKEANVYHATGGDASLGTDGHMAVKVFKTSILVFKDRDKYVKGDARYKGGYCRKNPRKMVKMWAEKEFRNLKRIHAAGIPSPEPVRLRDHVLVMTFLGKGDWAAPRLKDARLSDRALRRCYQSVVKMMRRMFRECGLVHADLSEYNMLYHKKQPYIIDVSQSVEHEHPRAFDFLRMDCKNVTDFFERRSGTKRRGGASRDWMSVRQLFDFVVDDGFGCGEDEMDARLAEVREQIDREADARAEGGDIVDDMMNAREIDERVFMQAYIPRSLADAAGGARPEDFQDALKAGGTESIVGKHLAALGLAGGEAPRAAAEEAHEESDGAEGSDRAEGSDGDPTATQDGGDDAFGDDAFARFKAQMLGMGAGLGADAAMLPAADALSDDESSSDSDGEGAAPADGARTTEAPVRAPAAVDPTFNSKIASKADRKAHKRAVKEAKAAKRKEKIKKSVKKRFRKVAGSKGK